MLLQHQHLVGFFCVPGFFLMAVGVQGCWCLGIPDLSPGSSLQKKHNTSPRVAESSDLYIPLFLGGRSRGGG